MTTREERVAAAKVKKPTPSALLIEALGGRALSTITVITNAVPPAHIVELAAAIDRCRIQAVKDEARVTSRRHQVREHELIAEYEARYAGRDVRAAGRE